MAAWITKAYQIERVRIASQPRMIPAGTASSVSENGLPEATMLVWIRADGIVWIRMAAQAPNRSARPKRA